MRIAGEIKHPRLKITIFHHNEKFSVQFEDVGLSQTYTIRESDTIQSANDVTSLIDDSFILGVETLISSMRENWQNKILSSIADTEFEEII